MKESTAAVVYVPVPLLRKAIKELRAWSQAHRNAGEFPDVADEIYALAVQLAERIPARKGRTE
jgi:hypothetical protein